MARFCRRQVSRVLSVLAAVLLSSPALAATKVALCLQWVHQAQFAGYYLAQDAGIYRRDGLQVEIRPGGPPVDPLTELGAGRCRFATAWLSEALDRRARGMPLVHLAPLIQRSSLMLVTFADGKVKTLQDLRGQRVGLWPRQFAVAPRALFARLGVKVREIRQGVSMAPFLARPAEALAAVMRRIDPHRSSSNLSHQRYMLRTIKRLMTFRVGMAGLGRLSRSDFGQVNRILDDQGLIPAPVPAAGFAAPVWKRP